MNYGYNIEHSAYSDITREADPDDEWGADDVNTTWSIGSTITKSDNSFADVVVPFELALDKNYYVVYVIYNTGDSFHRHEGYSCNFIEVFKEKSKAENLVKLIDTHNEDYNSRLKDLGENAYISFLSRRSWK